MVCGTDGYGLKEWQVLLSQRLANDDDDLVAAWMFRNDQDDNGKMADGLVELRR